MAWEIHVALKRLRAEKAVPRKQRELEARLSRSLSGLFADIERDVMQKLRAFDRVPAEDTTRRAIAAIVEQAEGDFRALVTRESMDAADYGRNRVFASLQRAGVSVTRRGFPDHTLNLLRESVFEASKRTMGRIVGDVMHNLSTSYEEGLGIFDTAERLGGMFEGLQDYELERIARTEINGAQNEGSHTTMRELGVNFEQWITAEDDRVRGLEDGLADHVVLHGQIVRIGDSFSNGLAHPGDRSGPIEEWINCRCRLVPYLMPEGMRAPDTEWFYEADLLAA